MSQVKDALVMIYFKLILVKQESLAGIPREEVHKRQVKQAGAEIARDWGLRNGAFYGEKLGLMRGFIDGVIDGAQGGKVDGLRDGRADEASFDKGYTDGYKLGDSNAKRQSEEVVYPDSYRSYQRWSSGKKFICTFIALK